jgi:tetratricopeptide (TPR) repeat protein
MNCRLALLRAQTAEKPADRRALLKAAVDADPLSDEPWNQLAAIERASWESRANRAAFERWEQVVGEAASRRPHWAAAREQAGDTYLQAFERDRRGSDLQAAVAQYEQAVELYPNHAENRAKLAIALAAAGGADRARQAAAEALRLDELSPHADQKLPAALRDAVRLISGERDDM